MNKEYKELAVIASRLAESVLMDWDKEEQVRLAREVACARQKDQAFVTLVRMMRTAQGAAYRAMTESDDYSEALIYINKAEELEKEVDALLGQMEV